MYTITHYINGEESYRKTYDIGTVDEHLIAHQEFQRLVYDTLEDYFNDDSVDGNLDAIISDEMIDIHADEGSPLILMDPKGKSHHLQISVTPKEPT